ncbi:hypothetical protein [Agromyces salentinus]|uniref:DUF222 domain-containing protein n=1 Tax=Agromyces salentinus TaxID=269421 RepID=A0ABN2MEP7_9MICO|nr:hypothetical protein [Agromyces salentinus]
MTTTPNADVQAFLASVQTLSAEQFAKVGAAALEIGASARVAARKTAKSSAADARALEKAVRDALEPAHDRLSTLEPGSIRNAVTDTLSAARAITHRADLTAVQYDALVGPFVGVGVAVPPHPNAGRR